MDRILEYPVHLSPTITFYREDRKVDSFPQRLPPHAIL